MRVRLRECRSPEEERAYYERVYPAGYRHMVWPDHVERVAASVEMIRRYGNNIKTAADLSCGDAAILRGIDDLLEQAYVGDLIGARGDYPLRTHVRVVQAGPLPDSLWSLPEAPLPVDLFVLSETLEHMPDPDGLLRQLTMFSQYLFLSTPVAESPDSGNLEHYWSWDTADVGDMLRQAGWTPLEMSLLVPVSTRHMENAYTYQMWMAVTR